MTQVVTAKDAKDVAGGVIGAATTVVLDGAAGFLTGEAGLKNVVKSQADIKSSSSKEFITGIGKGPGGPPSGPAPPGIYYKSNPQSLIEQQIANKLADDLAQIRTASRIGNRVVKVGTRASATQQNAQDSTKKSNYSGQSQQKSGKTGSAGNENQSLKFISMKIIFQIK